MCMRAEHQTCRRCLQGNDATDAFGDASLQAVGDGSQLSGGSSKARIRHADGTNAIGHMKVSASTTLLLAEDLCLHRD